MADMIIANNTSAKLSTEFLMDYFRKQSENPENETVCFCHEIADLVCEQQSQILKLEKQVAPQPDVNHELLAALELLHDTGTDSTVWPYAMSKASKAIAQAKAVAQQPTINQKLLEACRALLEVQRARRHPLGTPDEGIATMCVEAACKADRAIAKAESVESKTIRFSWDYHKHGVHEFFYMAKWIDTVAAGDTVLSYQEWVEHQLESLLQETDLDGVDAIEVAGCTETDGHVDVTHEGEEAAEFFSVYTHVPNQGVECVCDFNTKGQAVTFACALAARTGIPVYGNCCSLVVEDGGAK